MSLNNEPLSESQNKCEIRKGELWQFRRPGLASMLPVSLPRSVLLPTFKGIYTTKYTVMWEAVEISLVLNY